MGIGKRALLEDYYLDELEPLLAEWNALRRPEEASEQVPPETLLGSGGEWL